MATAMCAPDKVPRLPVTPFRPLAIAFALRATSVAAAEAIRFDPVDIDPHAAACADLDASVNGKWLQGR